MNKPKSFAGALWNQAIKRGEVPYNVNNDMDIHPCPKCKSNNIKCRGMITNCGDCGERWSTFKGGIN